MRTAEGPDPLRRQGHAPAPDHAHERQAARAGRQQAGALLRHRGDGRGRASRRSGIIIAPETGAGDRSGRRRRLALRRAHHLHRPGRAARASRTRCSRPSRSSATSPFVMYLGDNLLQGGIARPRRRLPRARARRADPADAGAGPRELRRGRALRGRAAARSGASCASSRSPPSRRPTWRSSACTCSRAAHPRRGPRDRALARAASSRSPTRSSISSTPGCASSRTSCAAGGRTRAGWRTCSRPTAWSSTTLVARIEGELIDSQRRRARRRSRPGRAWSAPPCAGPAIIGAGARLRDCYIGPYTAVGEDCTITGAEVEHSILLAGCTVCDLDGRMESSLLGPQRHGPPRRAPAARLPLHGRRQLRHLDPVRLLVTGAQGMLGHDVMRAGAARGARARAASICPSSTSPTPAPCEQLLAGLRGEAASLEAVVNCAAWTDVDGAETHEREPRTRSTPTAPATWRAPPRAIGVPLLHVSTDYVFDGTRRWTPRAAAPYVESDPTGPRVGLRRRRKLAGERQVLAASPRHTVVRTAWLFGWTGATSSQTMLRLAGERERGAGRRPTRSARPPGPGISRPRCWGCSSAACSGLVHLAGAGAGAPGTASRGRSSARPRSSAGASRPATAQMARPAPRPAWSALESERDDVLPLPPLAGRPRRLPRGARWDDARMRLLVCGGAGFIGSTFVRLRLREHGDEVDRARQAHLRRAARRTSHDFAERPALPLRARRDRGPRRGRRRRSTRAPRRSSTSPPRPTSTARSPSPTRSCARTRSAPTCCSRRPASAGCATCRSPPTRSTARSSEGTFTESSPLAPSSPYSATKAGADLLVQSYFHTYGLPAMICRGSNNYGPYQYPEKLIPLMILNALHGDPLPVYGDGLQVRNWIHVERLRRGRSATCSSTAAPGEVYNVGRARRVGRTSRWSGASSSCTGADESLIEYVTDRPGHDRRYSLSSEKVRALGWAPRVRFDDGLEQTVAWYRENTLVVGADPLGRVPRLLRAPVRALAASPEIFHFPPSLTSVSRASGRSCRSRCCPPATVGAAPVHLAQRHRLDGHFQPVGLAELPFDRRFAGPSCRPASPTSGAARSLGADLLLFPAGRVGLEVGDRLRRFVFFALEGGHRSRARARREARGQQHEADRGGARAAGGGQAACWRERVRHRHPLRPDARSSARR